TDLRQVDRDRPFEIDIHQARGELAQLVAVIRWVWPQGYRECRAVPGGRISIEIERSSAALRGVADEHADRADGRFESDIRPQDSGIENEARAVVEERDRRSAGKIQAEVEIDPGTGLYLRHRRTADIDEIGDPGERSGGITADQADQLGQVEVHAARAAVVVVLELQLDLERRARGDRAIERQLDLGVVEVRVASRIGESDGVFEQFFNRLKRLRGVALELFDAVGQIVGRLQKIAYAQVGQRQLLVEEPEGRGRGEVAHHAWHRLQHARETQVLEVEQLLETGLRHEQGARVGDVAPRHRELRPGRQREARQRRLDGHRQHQIGE